MFLHHDCFKPGPVSHDLWDMRFVQFAYKGSATPRVGVHLEEGMVVDLVSVTSASKAVEVLKEGQELIEKAEK